MDISGQIKNYIDTQNESKRADLNLIHSHILQTNPNIQLWFFDGKDENGKVIANPSIGYGNCLLNYKNGTSKEFYKIAMSVNTTGISIYIMGINSKNYLQETFSNKIGKAKVTSYCIKFKSLKEINLDILLEAIQEVN